MSNINIINEEFDIKIIDLCKRLYSIGLINEALTLLNIINNSQIKEELI